MPLGFSWAGGGFCLDVLQLMYPDSFGQKDWEGISFEQGIRKEDEGGKSLPLSASHPFY